MGIRLGFSTLWLFVAFAPPSQNHNVSDPRNTGLGAEWRTEDAPKGLAQIDLAVRFRFDKSGNADRVAVEIVLRNNSDTPIFFAEQSPDWDYELDIAGPDGQSRVELTNFGKCVLPHPIVIFRNIGRILKPGEADHLESVELNRLFKLDSVGLYRVVVRRRVWLKSPSLAKLISSEPAFFTLTSPQMDSSPPGFDPGRCR